MSKPKIEILFNSHKLKYREFSVIELEKGKKPLVYFNIDFGYLFNKYLHIINFTEDMTLSDEDINEFVLEFLNLIAHYKQYFYKYMK